MASPAPTRRVLGDLSVNTPTDVRGKSDGFVKMHKVVDGVSPWTPLSGEKNTRSGLVGGEKRKLDAAGGEACGSPKKAKREDGAGSGIHAEEAGIPQVEQTRSIPKRSAQCGGLDDDSPSSHQTSPDSSFSSSQAAFNDSHHTIFTEPDDAPIPAMDSTTHPSNAMASRDFRALTRDELRQKARDGMLRLRLASYKVRTNQVDVPMAQLQIRSSSHPASTSFADSYTASSNNQQRQIIPTLKIGSTIYLPEPPSSREGEQTSQILSSPQCQHNDTSAGDNLERIPDSPCKDERGNSTPRDGFATPLLPRQREGLLDPPQLGSPTPNTPSAELTSSVVKGRAADGLLSLMGQKE